jgi:hypothetical protein
LLKASAAIPAGRPKGESRAELIRTVGTPEIRQRMLDKMWALAADQHQDSNARIKAAEWRVKHGWPDEGKGQMTVTSDGAVTTVVHVHEP